MSKMTDDEIYREYLISCAEAQKEPKTKKKFFASLVYLETPEELGQYFQELAGKGKK